jgi:hypothetical protein
MVLLPQILSLHDRMEDEGKDPGPGD